MATNPKKSPRAAEIKRHHEEITLMVDQLCDCLMDYFDKYNISSAPISENTSYWNYLYNSSHGGEFSEKHTGILIRNLRNDDYTGLSSELNHWKFTRMINGMIGKDVELISRGLGHYQSVGDLLIKIRI